MDSKVEFLKALNKVQGTLEPVAKDAANPHFKSKYASLGAVNASVMGPLSEAGFVLLSGGVDIAGKAYLRTTLHHIAGHSESFDYPLVVDGNPQHIASSVTYARRYAICALLNLSVEDDDGNAAAPKAVSPAVSRVFTKTPDAPPAVGGVSANPVSKAQGNRFYAIAKASGKEDDVIKAYLLKAFGVARTDMIPRDQYDAACKWAEVKESVIEEVPF